MLNDSSSLPTGDPLSPPSVSPCVGDAVESLTAKLVHVVGGGSGAEVASDTALHATPTLGFIVLSDVTFDTVTPMDGFTATNLTGVTFPAGLTLPFRLAEWTLTIGSVLAILA